MLVKKHLWPSEPVFMTQTAGLHSMLLCSPEIGENVKSGMWFSLITKRSIYRRKYSIFKNKTTFECIP